MKVTSKRGERERALAFIVRMNYLMHTDLLAKKIKPPGCITRRLGSHFSFTDFCVNRGSNISWALSHRYDWKRALSCTTRVFVNLAFPLLPARHHSYTGDG